MTLREPLKTLALGCTSGSLGGITALSDYLPSNFKALEPQESSRIVPAVLEGLLTLDDAPHLLDWDTFPQIQKARLYLSTFFYFIMMADEDVVTAKHFVKHEAMIFSWLTLFQRYLFGSPESDLLLTIPDAYPDFLMMIKHVIQIVITFFQRTAPEVDFAGCELLTDTIFEFWLLLQRTSFDGCDAALVMVANYASEAIAVFVEASMKNRSCRFVDKIGGVPAVVPLFISSIDYYWNEAISQSKRGIPASAFGPLEQALCDMLSFAASRPYHDHIDLPAAFRYTSSVLRWVLKNRTRIMGELPDGSHRGHRSAPITYLQNYARFITNTLSFKRHYSLWHDLDMGLLKLIRSELPHEIGESASNVEEFEYLALFLSFHCQWFPVVLRKAQKLRYLPTLPAFQAFWDTFDESLGPLESGWQSALTLACKQTPRIGRLRVCSGCHVVRYCSLRCQYDAWKAEHRVVCQLLRLSGGTHPLICTNDTIGVAYVAGFELSGDVRLVSTACSRALHVVNMDTVIHTMDSVNVRLGGEGLTVWYRCDSLADGEHRRLREDGKSCECKDGWGGINCNVCKRDDACKGFPLAGGISQLLGLNPLDDDQQDEISQNMTCYNGGETVFENHQMCDVTNVKILDMLPDRPPQVTFSCTMPPSEEDSTLKSSPLSRLISPYSNDLTSAAASSSSNGTCAFQFWTAEVESFYCALEQCSSSRSVGYDRNVTRYDCEKIKCRCVPGRFICGEDGSIDISDFLSEEIKGPASFSCLSNSVNGTIGESKADCKFEEPAMNELIDTIFGDAYISLKCYGGECLHYSQVPGYVRPPKPDNTLWVALSSAGACLVVLLTSAVLWYAGRSRAGSDFGKIRLPEDEAAKLMSEHVPASLYFSNISYWLPSPSGLATPSSNEGFKILDGISGAVHPGQVMAIMGASGAGKSTLLDILARKYKLGSSSGTTLINGRVVKDSEFRSVTGFVDQEDTLMSTLTVYETVLYSALLRLPRDMSEAAKKYRVLETLSELGIMGIKDKRIGETGRRGISGGEKRRVSIACELVTSPSILFLDEPTSGLDAYNAFNVVESLVSLARNYKRTVIFTIHQPRSNIVALFDHLLLLAQGKMVYSGELSRCQEYFESIGCKCPPGFNLADYLIDLTMHAGMDSSHATPAALDVPIPVESRTNLSDEERAFLSASRLEHRASLDAIDETELEQLNSPGSAGGSSTAAEGTVNIVKRKASELLSSAASSLRSRRGSISGRKLTPKLQALVDAYEQSTIAKEIKLDGEEMQRNAEGGGTTAGASSELPDVAVETEILRGRKRASWLTQFRILSGRAFKNLYRDPALLNAHYLSSIGLALICGLFFHNVTNDIAGFQNRLGIFFFTLALFGFSCLSSLGLFANERILFIRERANGYYSSFTYFASKVLFDILPLRMIPPLMFGGIVYGLVGLVPTVQGFWKFMLTLVLFNLTTASVVLWLSIAFDSISVASLVGTLVMLFNLLFTGLLINRESVPVFLQWLHTISFFHAAFEALAVNELRYLQLKETKYGVELDVPAATILSTFGLRAQSFWWPNITLLGIFFVSCTIGSFITLHYFVKEKR
ncbi:hypothetical protein ONZ45_g4288 [Pleurotus djamor]|nr:hypothetical protein ONZ45_g4288 [Pleurotus djamor]